MFCQVFVHVNRRQSHVREILATGCKFMANDDSERNKARFSGKMFYIKYYGAGYVSVCVPEHS